VGEFAHAHGLKVHLDGARIFNASVAQGVDVKEFTQHVDSLTFCLSKGLAAPLGSVICGTRDFIQQVHRQRKVLGGGMRQAGFAAAARRLETMVERLSGSRPGGTGRTSRSDAGLVINNGGPAEYDFSVVA
jgi:threonine aldolase